MFNIRRVAPENPGQAPPKIVFRIPPFCCEGAPAFRRGEESRLTIALLHVMWYYVSHEPESRVGTCDVGRCQTVHRLYRPA